MKNFLLIISILAFASCKMNIENTKIISEEQLIDNPEIIEIYKNDQADRQTMDIAWQIVSKNDSLREIRIYQLLDSNKIRTSNDYQNAAMIFQHGGDSTAYGMAVKFMRKSIELDSTANKWLLAAATDRYLLSKDEPQIYGTQYEKFEMDEPWQLGKIDTTKVTDAERIVFGVETLAEQKEKVKRMNKRELSELLSEEKSVDQIIKIIKLEHNKDSEFDMSESGINSFGYEIMRERELKEALKIFALNTNLYPDAFNTWDSYGECLFILGQKDKSLKAYKKSLRLNPNNKNAATIIKQNK